MKWVNTPLHFACRMGDYKLAIELIGKGVNASIKNNKGQTAGEIVIGDCRKLFKGIKQMKILII